MGLEKIQIDRIKEILEKTLKDYSLFVNYELIKWDIQEISTPTKVVEYNFTFTSEKINRWLFIRIQDFFTYQNLTILINQVNEKKISNIDVKNYFISELKNNKIKQRMTFKSISETTLEDKIKKAFQYVMQNIDEDLKKVFEGKIWIEMPIDWGTYK